MLVGTRAPTSHRTLTSQKVMSWAGELCTPEECARPLDGGGGTNQGGKVSSPGCTWTQEAEGNKRGMTACDACRRRHERDGKWQKLRVCPTLTQWLCAVYAVFSHFCYVAVFGGFKRPCGNPPIEVWGGGCCDGITMLGCKRPFFAA